MVQHKVQYGTSSIRYSLSRSNRKTLAIEVYPDLSVKVIAPQKATIKAIQEKVLKRAQWIKKQQYFFEQFIPRTTQREFVSGESHYYLGRKYILRVRKSMEESVKLMGGELIVMLPDVSDSHRVEQVITNWYNDRAFQKFEECLDESMEKFKEFSIEKPQLVIRKMARRWGSCTLKGQIILNPEVVKAPTKCIAYVVVHELSHLVHYNHSHLFYKLQSEVMPDWMKWKLKLEQVLS